MFEPDSLLNYWNSLVERCGLVLEDGTVVELVNVHDKPQNNFSFSQEEFNGYPNCVATWHTHPHGNPNLSVEDYKAFLTRPNLFHYIVGNGKVWGFYIQENKVLLYEDSDFSRLP